MKLLVNALILTIIFCILLLNSTIVLSDNNINQGMITLKPEWSPSLQGDNFGHTANIFSKYQFCFYAQHSIDTTNLDGITKLEINLNWSNNITQVIINSTTVIYNYYDVIGQLIDTQIIGRNYQTIDFSSNGSTFAFEYTLSSFAQNIKALGVTIINNFKLVHLNGTRTYHTNVVTIAGNVKSIIDSEVVVLSGNTGYIVFLPLILIIGGISLLFCAKYRNIKGYSIPFALIFGLLAANTTFWLLDSPTWTPYTHEKETKTIYLNNLYSNGYNFSSNPHFTFKLTIQLTSIAPNSYVEGYCHITYSGSGYDVFVVNSLPNDYYVLTEYPSIWTTQLNGSMIVKFHGTTQSGDMLYFQPKFYLNFIVDNVTVFYYSFLEEDWGFGIVMTPKNTQWANNCAFAAFAVITLLIYNYSRVSFYLKLLRSKIVN